MGRLKSPAALQVLILFGILLGCSGIVLHLALPAKYERIEFLPIIVGFGIALFGAYWMDPDRAKKAAEGVTHAGDEVVDSVVKLRTGKRATDPVVEVTKSRPADDPDAAPTTEVKVTAPGTPSVPKDGE